MTWEGFMEYGNRKAAPMLGAALALASGLMASLAGAEEVVLAPMVIIGETQDGPVDAFASEREEASTVYRLDAEEVALFGAAGGGNAYSLVSRLPGVQMQLVDAYGLVNMQGGNKGLRVRGEIASHGANGTVEGVPLNGPGPGPGYLFLLDAENIDSVSLAQGPIAPDRFSLYDTVGQLDTRILWPKAEFGGKVSVGAGENDFSRTFARLDSGRLPTGTAMFLSGSSTSAQKWRGHGDSPERHETFAFGLSQDFGRLQAKLFVAHNEMVGDNYKGLTYEEARHASRYDDIDYDRYPSGTTAAAWANWQGYNRQSFETSAFLSEISYRLGEHTQLVLKPFYSKEEGYYLYPNGNFVRRWDIDHTTYGASSELHTRWGETGLKFGYALVSMEPPGPPNAWRHYRPDASGGLTFNNWALLAKVTDRHEMHNLFATAERRFGPLEVKGGVRYVRDVLPSIDYYDTAGVTAEDFDDAIDQSSGVVDARSVQSTTIREWAPYLGLRYEASERLELRAALGRNVGSPAFDAFQKPPVAGLSKQALWNASEMEIGDTLDLAARFSFSRGYFEPVLYYTRYRNKGVDIYDPAYNASYTQNIGKAHQLGLTLAGGWQLRPDLDMFGNLSFMRSQFDDDLLVGVGDVREVEGERLPDVPARMATLGAAWRFGRFTLTPVVHYMGNRYADIEHTQRMGGYAVANLDLTHRLKSRHGQFTTSLAVINLFDKRYIGFNNANETSNGSTFYPGPPRTLVGKFSFEF